MAVVPEDDYDFEYEYRIIDFNIKKEEILTIPDGFSIVKVLSAFPAAMEDSWNLTVLIERETLVNGD